MKAAITQEMTKRKNLDGNIGRKREVRNQAVILGRNPSTPQITLSLKDSARIKN